MEIYRPYLPIDFRVEQVIAFKSEHNTTEDGTNIPVNIYTGLSRVDDWTFEPPFPNDKTRRECWDTYIGLFRIPNSNIVPVIPERIWKDTAETKYIEGEGFVSENGVVNNVFYCSQVPKDDGTCSINTHQSQGECESAGATWTPRAFDSTTLPELERKTTYFLFWGEDEFGAPQQFFTTTQPDAEDSYYQFDFLFTLNVSETEIYRKSSYIPVRVPEDFPEDTDEDTSSVFRLGATNILMRVVIDTSIAAASVEYKAFLSTASYHQIFILKDPSEFSSTDINNKIYATEAFYPNTAREENLDAETDEALCGVELNYEDGDIFRDTGSIIYIENRTTVTRQSNQEEEIQIIIEF
jgi:hypothetical protein